MAGNSVVGTGEKEKGKAPETVVQVTQPMDYKVPQPSPFDGKRSELKGFLVKCELYFGFNQHKFGADMDKVLWVVNLLKGPAFDWMEAHVTDYMDNKGQKGELVPNNMYDDTVTIFGSWTGFKTQISRVFGDIDQERTSEHFILNHKQRGSAATYTAQFQQHMGKTDWDDSALKALYYEGLKDHVKDEIVRSGRPNTLHKMIEKAIEIDNRAYERSMEKKGQRFTPKAFGKRKGSYWPQPMELDATFKPSGRPGRPRDPKKEWQFKEKLCFNCDKPGHMARDCKQPRKGQGRKPFGRKQLNATQQGRRGHNELAVASNNEFDWDVDADEFYESQELSDEEETPSLTTSEKGFQEEIMEGEKPTPAKREWLKGVVREYRGLTQKAEQLREQVKEVDQATKPLQNAIRKMNLETQVRQGKRPVSDDMIPGRPRGTWQHGQQQWERFVTETFQHPDFPYVETVMNLSEKSFEKFGLEIQEYGKKFGIPEYREREPTETTNQFEERTREQLEALAIARENGKTELTKMDAAELDHPWHRYTNWEHCRHNRCWHHWAKKNQYQTFPMSSPKIFFKNTEEVEAVRRNYSEGALPTFEPTVGKSKEKDEERDIPSHLLYGPRGRSRSDSDSSSHGSKN